MQSSHNETAAVLDPLDRPIWGVKTIAKVIDTDSASNRGKHSKARVSGAAAGGVTGALIAGPIGTAVGAGGGAIAGSVISGRS